MGPWVLLLINHAKNSGIQTGLAGAPGRSTNHGVQHNYLSETFSLFESLSIVGNDKRNRVCNRNEKMSIEMLPRITNYNLIKGNKSVLPCCCRSCSSVTFFLPAPIFLFVKVNR